LQYCIFSIARTNPSPVSPFDNANINLHLDHRQLPALESESESELETHRRHKAATLLNAVTRGFLVRRLFRTEQVQRIVQTIRDTLIFVLNLHLETYGTKLDQEEPANIRLKARLLQQVNSIRF